MHQLTAVDWSWLAGFLAVALGLSLYHARRSSQSMEDYFVAGKNTPWWILGTSIVATTFAADTPLAVCGLVISQGISGNWYWWSVVPSGMLGVFFFARLWRRSGCLTQAEFATLRYGAGRAKPLRVFYVFYHGVLKNAVTLGWVNLAMAKIITLCTSLNEWQALGVCMVLTVVYTTVGGINGVMWTDFLQFFLAIGSSIAIGYYVVQAVGGLDVLRSGDFLAFSPTGAGGEAQPALIMRLFPGVGTSQFSAFLIFMTVYWISCTPTDCNGYAVQRLLCARDERHAVWGYLWYNFAHFVLRPWPWIVVGVCAVITLNQTGEITQDPEGQYVTLLLQKSPAWLIGPALASLLAAYMSTIDTHLNWSASYLINDFYAPYVNPGQPARHYVAAGRVATVLMAAAGVGATALMNSIVEGWGLFFGLMSGMGIVGILRWMWWRITAWTELGCMLAAGTSTLAVHLGAPQIQFPFTLLIIVPIALIGAAVGTFGFRPEPRSVLAEFARKVRPPGPGWMPVDLTSAAHAEGYEVMTPGNAMTDKSVRFEQPADARSQGARQGLLRPALCWLMSTVAIYCALFGTGDMLLKSTVRGLTLCLVAAGLALVVGFLYRPDASAGGSSVPRAHEDSPS